eukprot:CAMPEP_0184377636 /NCGR_PEP_ID=MMETSP0007-20130409/2433_1 /TAXON_ID=97485 /ORGANISM="Prymnesium parvum, Strain Texoma1" /LENGTH=106 /DNA_ID=CAMNT_0026721623 /DNA_START=418 /DNA_END=736 /DNA_ORIENTATION=+
MHPSTLAYSDQASQALDQSHELHSGAHAPKRYGGMEQAKLAVEQLRMPEMTALRARALRRTALPSTPLQLDHFCSHESHLADYRPEARTPRALARPAVVGATRALK